MARNLRPSRRGNIKPYWRATDSLLSTLTIMQDKNCVDCYNVYSIQGRDKDASMLGANMLVVNETLVLHVSKTER